jgi:hypothetical protein
LAERKSDKLFLKKSSVYLVEGGDEKFIWSRSNLELLLTNYSPYKKINIPDDYATEMQKQLNQNKNPFSNQNENGDEIENEQEYIDYINQLNKLNRII